jgi:aspartyl-tRNA(Asn)/glutamyl-tRNA(Gln) amidotransferase subunit B
MFCSCPSGVESPPNAAVCPVCMGHPGTLPIPNRVALEKAVLMILALDGTVNEHSKFDRKHYFYPDLPKGYQISQFDQPLGTGGHLDITVDGKIKQIALTRLHVEEDAAKLHHGDAEHSLVDYNRSGTPLAEIVTEPDFRSAKDAKIFLQELRLLTRAIGISDANMEKGQLRCDANVSLRPVGDEVLYAKTEVKNMNSFRAVERALTYEIQRQTKLWKEAKRPSEQTTRGWDDVQQITTQQRTKEEAHDYRYFPEPDIPPLLFPPDVVHAIHARLPELPQRKRDRFIDEYAMSADDARIIIEDKALADWTEYVISELRAWLIALDPSTDSGQEESEEEKWANRKKQLVKLTTGWITSKLFALMSEKNIPFESLSITAENFAELISIIYERRINSTTAQDVLRAMLEPGVDPSTYIEEEGLAQMDDSAELEAIVAEVIEQNTETVEKIKAGKESALQYLVGQVMKETKGKADPALVQKILKKALL